MTVAFQAMLAAATGKPCGRGRLPLVAGHPCPTPYSVLYPLESRYTGAPLGDKTEDAHLVYQVTVVADREDQAEWLADRVRRAVLAREASGQWVYQIEAPGTDVWARQLLLDDGLEEAGADVDVVTAVQRYELSASATP
ncbi:hypothetical protein [Streptomyces kanamyceticus]|uniref:hypothetical protein n=1 Tax=Streptomyces kanamyceticus TaxID=1967 RepID=UPI0037DC3130